MVHNLRMGATVAVVGLRQGVDCKPVIGQTDQHLVARVRVGEDAAFEAIYDRYAGGVLAFCVHMLRSREAAEDALQLTFVSAYRALRAADSSMSLRPWLYTIARNRCLSELRARRDGVDVDGVTVERPCFDGVADQVQRREELSEMLEDMQRLPSDQRAALVLFELGDHSHKEIAAVLGVRREKVKALIFQAREALVRSRQARDRPCVEIRERLATLHGRVLPRSTTRAHIDRCPSCAAFEDKVRRQRAALALIVPVTLTSELKAAVLGSALGGAVAAGAGACGSGAVVPAGTGAAGAVSAAGGATGAGGAGAGAVTMGAGTAGLAGAGTGAASSAVVAGAPVSAVATGLTAVGADYAASVGVGGLGATGVVAKLLTAAAIATWAAGASHPVSDAPRPIPVLATVLQIPITSASPAIAPTGAPAPGASTTPAATPSSANTTTSTMPAATPSSANTTTSTTPDATPSSANTTTSTTPDATPSSANTTTSTTPAATPSSANTTTSTTPAATPSSANTTTSTTPAATPSSANTTTSTTPAATPSSANTTTSTTAAATPSTTTSTTEAATPSSANTTTETLADATPSSANTTPTAAPSDPGMAAAPTDGPTATEPVPDPTGAPATVDAVAPASATGG